MTPADLAAHQTTFDQPISVEYKGVRLWEMPPNGQGIVALMILNLLETFDLKGRCLCISRVLSLVEGHVTILVPVLVAGTVHNIGPCLALAPVLLAGTGHNTGPCVGCRDQ